MENYTNMVRNIAGRYSSVETDKDELFQVGCVGLIKALDNFNTKYEVPFSTYAVPMINGEIRRYLREEKAPAEVELQQGADKISQVQDTAEAGDCQDVPLDDLTHMIRLREEFRRLRNRTGLISPEGCGIHLKEDYFLEVFGEYEVIRRDDQTFPYMLTAEYDQVKFFCITKKPPKMESDSNVV